MTGGAGFIGSHTVDLLLQRGFSVRILDALTPPVHREGRIPDYVPLEDVEFMRGDVCDRSAWEEALVGVDAVIHLAAYQDYLPDFSRFFHVNTVGTALLYEVIVAKRLPVRRVVVASSQATYGEAKYECCNDRCPLTQAEGRGVRYPSVRDEEQLKRGEWEVRCPSCGEVMHWVLTDEAVTKPHNQYAISKYTQEMVALTLGRRYGIPSVCMRYSIVQGARQSFRNAYSGILRIFTQRLLTGRPPICYEDGGQVRDYVSVHDVARANLLVLEDPRADFEAFNVGTGLPVSVLEYAALLAARAGTNLAPQVPGLYRFGDTRHVVSDISKLKALGWRPAIPLEWILDEYVAWALAQPGFGDYYADAEARMRALGTLRQSTAA